MTDTLQETRPRRDQEDEDLALLCQRPEFARVMTGMLHALAVGREISESEVGRHNLGVRLLKKIGRAHPEMAGRMLCHLYGI